VLSPAENLEWANDVHGIHAIVERDEDTNRLVMLTRLFDDCTHFDGLCGGMGFGLGLGVVEEGKEEKSTSNGYVPLVRVGRPVTCRDPWGLSGEGSGLNSMW
jgi:hypothetical protein